MRMFVAIFIAALLTGWPGPGGHFAGAQDAQGGIDPALLERAEAGDVNAQMKLGKQLVKGITVRRDFEAAEKWFNRATAQRPKRAVSVGMIYQREKATTTRANGCAGPPS